MNTLLRTRRSQPVLRTNGDRTIDPAVPSDRPNRLTAVPTLFRKVSALFTSEKKEDRGRTRIRMRTRSTPLSNIGIGHITSSRSNNNARPVSRYSSRSPSPPSIDIRLPDGLGPRVDDDGARGGYNNNSSNRTASRENGKEGAVSWIPFVKDPSLLVFEEPRLGLGHDRARCLSSPGLLSSFPVRPNKLILGREPEPSSYNPYTSSEVDSLEFIVPTNENEHEHEHEKSTTTSSSLHNNIFIPDIPPEIMLLIASFLGSPPAAALTPFTPTNTKNTPNDDTLHRTHTTSDSRADLTSLARVSKAFLVAARKTLYGTLDFRFIPDDKSVLLGKVLERKEKKELAGYVENVILETWPAWVLRPRPDQEDAQQQLSSSSVFIKALNNMHALTSLTLPSISPLLPALLPTPTILPLSRPPSRPSSRSRTRSQSNLSPRSRLRSRSHSTLPPSPSPQQHHHQHIHQNQPFRLTHLTLLNRTLSHEDRQALFEWLGGQVDLVKLELPRCVDREGDESALAFGAPPAVSTDTSPRKNERHNTASPQYSSSNSNSNSKRSIRSKQSASRPRTPPPAYFLPSLTTLHAPPSLILHLSSLRSPPPSPSPSSPPPNSLSSHSRSSPSPKPLSPTSLTPPRPQATPLTRIILPIHTTIYTGLRPTALMRALRGVMELKIVFGGGVDRRSVERIVGAVGDEIGFGGRRFEVYGGELGEDGWERRYWEEKDGLRGEEEDGERDGELDSLEIEVAWDGGDTEADESLYRAVQSVLPRFRTLQTLRITAAASSRPPVIRRPTPPPPPPPAAPPKALPSRAPAPAKPPPPKPKPRPRPQPQQQKPHHPQTKHKNKNKPLPAVPLTIQVPFPLPLSGQIPFPSLRIKKPSSSSRTSSMSRGSGDTDAEGFFTPKEFEFAVEEVVFPGARVVRDGGRKNGGGGVGFQFEIGHRQCDEKSEAGESEECEHDDNHNGYDHDETPTTHRPEFEHDHDHKRPSPPSQLNPPQPIPQPNYHDCESDRTQLASWLKQCPTLQTVTFLSGAEWCFLAEGVGSGVWINSYD